MPSNTNVINIVGDDVGLYSTSARHIRGVILYIYCIVPELNELLLLLLLL